MVGKAVFCVSRKGYGRRSPYRACPEKVMVGKAVFCVSRKGYGRKSGIMRVRKRVMVKKSRIVRV